MEARLGQAHRLVLAFLRLFRPRFGLIFDCTGYAKKRGHCALKPLTRPLTGFVTFPHLVTPLWTATDQYCYWRKLTVPEGGGVGL